MDNIICSGNSHGDISHSEGADGPGVLGLSPTIEPEGVLLDSTQPCNHNAINYLGKHVRRMKHYSSTRKKPK